MSAAPGESLHLPPFASYHDKLHQLFSIPWQMVGMNLVLLMRLVTYPQWCNPRGPKGGSSSSRFALSGLQRECEGGGCTTVFPAPFPQMELLSLQGAIAGGRCPLLSGAAGGPVFALERGWCHIMCFYDFG